MGYHPEDKLRFVVENAFTVAKRAIDSPERKRRVYRQSLAGASGFQNVQFPAVPLHSC